MSLIELFNAGGPVMWPLAFCSLVALTIIIERAINLRASRILDPVVVDRVRTQATDLTFWRLGTRRLYAS